MGIKIYEDASIEIARRSRGTPRIANALLRRVRDFAEIKGNGDIEIEITKFALNALKVDEYGLDEMDNKILRTMIENFKARPLASVLWLLLLEKIRKHWKKYMNLFLFRKALLFVLKRDVK
jgi:Holliday junction resolvasome RuvABC ATP-dependent DNA helicase subunit